MRHRMSAGVKPLLEAMAGHLTHTLTAAYVRITMITRTHATQTAVAATAAVIEAEVRIT